MWMWICILVFYHLPTRYFFAGGSARSPLSNVDAYFSFCSSRFCWTGVAILLFCYQGKVDIEL